MLYNKLDLLKSLILSKKRKQCLKLAILNSLIVLTLKNNNVIIVWNGVMLVDKHPRLYLELFNATDECKYASVGDTDFFITQKGPLGRGMYFFDSLNSAMSWGRINCEIKRNMTIKVAVRCNKPKLIDLDTLSELSKLKEWYAEVLSVILKNQTITFRSKLDALSFIFDAYLKYRDVYLVVHSFNKVTLENLEFTYEEIDLLSRNAFFSVRDSKILKYKKKIRDPINDFI